MVWEFPKIRGTVPCFGVLIIWILLFRVLYWGPLFSETPIWLFLVSVCQGWLDAQIFLCASSTTSARLRVIYLQQQHLAPSTEKLEDSFRGTWTSKSTFHIALTRNYWCRQLVSNLQNKSEESCLNSFIIVRCRGARRFCWRLFGLLLPKLNRV